MIKLLWAISFFKNINKNKQLWKGYQNKDALAKRIKTFKVNFLAILLSYTKTYFDYLMSIRQKWKQIFCLSGHSKEGNYFGIN